MAAILEEMLGRTDIAGAEQAFRQMRSSGSSDYSFSEGQFNAAGYRLMNRGLLKEAIAMFLWNVDMYPESWNVYDSLAEAYMNDGQNALAIQHYEKSLELNPQNQNARDMLARLRDR